LMMRQGGKRTIVMYSMPIGKKILAKGMDFPAGASYEPLFPDDW